jgi:hypothetical protein
MIALAGGAISIALAGGAISIDEANGVLAAFKRFQREANSRIDPQCEPDYP